MKIDLTALARLVDAEISGGDPHRIISGVDSLKDAAAGDVAFYASGKYKDELAATKAGWVLFGEDSRTDAASYHGDKLFTKNVRSSWIKVLRFKERDMVSHPKGVSAKADIATSVRLGAGVSVGSFTVIGEDTLVADNTVIYAQCYIGSDVTIGKDCVIYPRVTVREGAIIGDRVIIHPGTVIGADGYGYVQVEGRHEKVPQLGIVEIQDDVELGANVAVDRAALGRTVVGAGTKVDNMVHIAHNVQIGKNCLFIAQSGVAGSTIIGNNVIVGGQSAIRDNVEIGDGVIIGPQAGVIGNLKSGEVVFGTPCIDIKESMRLSALYRKLPEMYKKFKSLP